MKTFDLVVRTYEEGGNVPVVTHVFHGKTPEQAQGFYKAHLKYDKFLRFCKTGSFQGMKCRNEVVGLFPREG